MFFKGNMLLNYKKKITYYLYFVSLFIFLLYWLTKFNQQSNIIINYIIFFLNIIHFIIIFFINFFFHNY